MRIDFAMVRGSVAFGVTRDHHACQPAATIVRPQADAQGFPLRVDRVRRSGWRGGDGPGAQTNQALNLTTDDVKARVERWLAIRGNARLKVGDVKEKDADTITADIVTKDNSLVQRFAVNRHNGFYKPEEE